MSGFTCEKRMLLRRSQGRSEFLDGFLCSVVALVVFTLMAFGTAMGDRPIVARVQIEGARSVPVRDVQAWLVTRAGVAVDSALLRKDVQRVLEGYKKRGFWHVAVSFPKIVRKKKTTVVFAIAEGERTRVADVQVRGELIFEAADVREAFGLARGAVLIESELNRHLDRLLRFYENRGYPFCALHPDVQWDENGAGVQVAVSPGQLVRIDIVQFEGNEVTRDEVLSRHVSVGEIYDQRRVDAFVRRLQNLPFIDRVHKVELVPTGEEMALVIGLEESRHTRIEGGVGLGSGQTLTGAIALDVLNVSGGGREGYALWARRGEGASNLRVSYREPYVFNSAVSARGRVEMTERVGYVTQRFGGGADVGIGENAHLFGGVAYRRVLPDSTGLGFYDAEKMWSLESGVRIDRRVHETRGWQAEFRGEIGEVARGIRRVRWAADGRVFWPLGRRSVLAGRARVSWVGQTGGVPATAGIWLGGAQSLRGYREERFWGTNAGWLNVEWRRLLGPKTRVFAFVDAGRIRGDGAAIWPVSYGVGLLATGRMGAVGIDYGLPWRESPAQGMVHVRMIRAF